MIHLQLPKNAVVRGMLDETGEPSSLTQDVLEVALQDGLVIDVGWYPEHDLSGNYWIRVFREQWENQLIEPILVDQPSEVQQIVEQLAKQYDVEQSRVAAALPDRHGP